MFTLSTTAAQAFSSASPAILLDAFVPTIDGQLVPRLVAETALRQHTAMLVNGLLIGAWIDID